MTLLGMIMAAQATAATSPTLSVFKPLVGACWRADFAPTVQDTHCFEAMYGGAHIRDRHEVRDKGRAVYSGETIYSVEDGKVVFSYYNSMGGVGRGVVILDGANLCFKRATAASRKAIP